MALLITAVMLYPWKTIFANRCRETVCLLTHSQACSSITISPDSLWSVMMKVTSDLWPSEMLQCSLMKCEELIPESMDPKKIHYFAPFSTLLSMGETVIFAYLRHFSSPLCYCEYSQVAPQSKHGCCKPGWISHDPECIHDRLQLSFPMRLTFIF